MLEPGNPNYRLQDLEQRWAADPDSRLYQQLAEEYRKTGQTEKAAEVLQAGLERRPRDVGGHVALGRCYLELRRSDEARKSFEAVIDRDPAHHVANKLLIETHLLTGDAEAASERLEIYQLLNDRDPEIEHFAYRLRQLRTQPQDTERGADTTVRSESDEDFDDTLPMGTSIEDVASAALPRPTFAGPHERAVPSGSGAPAGDTGPEADDPSRERSPMADEAPTARDEIFALGAPPEPPVMDSLWAEAKAARHTRAREPFANLLEKPWVASPPAANELFPQAMVPPTATPPAATPGSPEPTRTDAPAPEAEVAEAAGAAEPVQAEQVRAESVAEVPTVEAEAVVEEASAEAVADSALAAEAVTADDTPSDSDSAGALAAGAVAAGALAAGALAAEALAGGESTDEVVDEAAPADEEPTAALVDAEPYSEWVEDRSAVDELAPTQPLPKLSLPKEFANKLEPTAGFEAVEPESDSVAPASAESVGASEPNVASVQDVEEPAPVDTVQAGSGLGPVVVTPPETTGEAAEGFEDGPTGKLEPFVAESVAEDPAMVEPAMVEPAMVEPAMIEPAAAELPVEEPEGGQPAAASEGEEVATVTLGNLYLKQGHLGEAAKVFEQVLAHEPDNVAAHEGLAMAQGVGFPSDTDAAESGSEAVAEEVTAEEPTASEPLVAAPETVETSAEGAVTETAELTAQGLLQAQIGAGSLPADPTAQKVLVLSNYLKHLKMARERHDVH